MIVANQLFDSDPSIRLQSFNGRFGFSGVQLAQNRRYCAFDLFLLSPREFEINDETANGYTSRRDGFARAQHSTGGVNRRGNR